MFLNDNLVSCSTKTNMTQNDLTPENDTQESLYDAKGIAHSRKAGKKFYAFKDTQTNKLIKKATNTLKNLIEVKAQYNFSKTADDMFRKMIVVHLTNMNEGAVKEFLKLDIHRYVIPAVHHNG